MAIVYRGFNTQGGTSNFRLTNLELIKQDITNHFNIRKGEKLMNPNFGTIIWNVLFEPFTEDLKSVIVQDIKSIAKYDPRVIFDSVLVTEYDSGILVELRLRYAPTDQSTAMRLRFNGQTNSLTVQ
jgi:phage baseplate assembly protein W